MITGESGINLIKKFEGCKLTAYLCPAGVWTIGYGHTEGVKKGDKITQDKAEELLKQDLSKFEDALNSYGFAISQNQFDALISFIFNIGISAFRTSTMFKYLRKNQYVAAADQFNKWVYVNHKPSKGLERRREAERALFKS